MSETAVAPAPATPAKAEKKAAPKKKTTKAASGAKKAKAPANHPKYLDMTVNAIKALKERNGSSRQALHK